MSVSTVYDDVKASVYEPNEAGEAGECQDETADEVAVDGYEELGGHEDEVAADGYEIDLDGDEVATDGDDDVGQKRGGAPERSEDAKRRRCDAERSAEMSDAERAGALRRQIEYYFSDTNLVGDQFFHEKMSEDPDGWLDAWWLLGCSRVKQLGVTGEAVIEAALEGSDLETRQRPVCAAEEGEEKEEDNWGTLQVRRTTALPPLAAAPTKPAGWLAEKIAEKRRARESGEAPPAAAPADGNVPEAHVFVAGESVRVTSGELGGQVGQVLSVEDSEVTVLIGGADVVTLQADDIALASVEAAAEPEACDPPAEPHSFAVGEKARISGGDLNGQIGQVLSVEGTEVTLASGGEFETKSAAELVLASE